MPQLMDQRDLIFPAEGVEGQLHIKTAVLTDGNRIGACHGLAEAKDGIAGGFLAGKWLERLPTLWLRRGFGLLLMLAGARAVLT